MKKQLLLSGAGLILALAGSSYWYVMVAGAPQWDGPQALAHSSKLSFKIETYLSKVMGQERSYGIILPPNYNLHPKQFYPVIFLLHGGHGSPTDWVKKASADSVIEKLYNEGELPYSIIITPDGNDLRGSSPFWDSDYFDGPNGKVSTAIGLELVQLIKLRYRVRLDRKFWAIGGLSSGGWGAVNIGLHHLDRFSILFSHSGYFSDRSGWQNSPLEYIKHIPTSEQQKVKLYIDAGSNDGNLLQQSKKFHQVLEQLKVKHVFNQFPGGHGLAGADTGWNYWHKHLADSLTYVGQQFQEAEQSLSKPKYNRSNQIDKPLNLNSDSKKG